MDPITLPRPQSHSRHCQIHTINRVYILPPMWALVASERSERSNINEMGALRQWVRWSLVLFVLARFAKLQNCDLLSKSGAALSPSLLRVPNSIYRFFKHFYTSVPLFTVKFHVSVEFLCWKVGGSHRFAQVRNYKFKFVLR